MAQFDHNAHHSANTGSYHLVRTGAHAAQTRSHVNISEPETRYLRHRLQLEITWLARQVDELLGSDDSLDLSLRQTYREMIFSRRALLGRIPR